jgi:hypothetical protein
MPLTTPLTSRIEHGPESEFLERHSRLLLSNFRRWTGDGFPGIGTGTGSLAELLFDAPFVLVSHGTESDPVLNYGNRTALKLWEMPWDKFVQTPSRLTAEAPDREERSRLLHEVTTHGFIKNYSGVRVSSSGRRFSIHNAIVWNLFDEAARFAGQAAMFDHWSFLDGPGSSPSRTGPTATTSGPE